MCDKDLCESTLSADMSTNSRPTWWPSVSRYVGCHIGWYVSGHSANTSPDMLRLTVSGVSVDCRWYRSIVRHCFAEIASPYPQGTQTKILSPMLVCWQGKDAAQTISNTYLFAVLLEGIHVCSSRIAGFTEQGTAFTCAQSAILQNCDSILRVQQALKITYPWS